MSRAKGPEPLTADLVATLLRPDAFAHRSDHLELHETHISWVILAGPFAYKIKKPVDLGFLDFTSRERRVQDCDDEVRLNRRLCPDVYLGVLNIVARDGAYFIGGAGEAYEPVVWMRRLPSDGMLPVLLERGTVTPDLIRQIARRLAVFHSEAATGPGVDEYGSPETIRANWNENFAQIAPVVGRTLTADVLSALESFVARFQAEQRGLIERRVRTGRIREGHGDLHAASICVEDTRVHLFDCLEFAPRFRCSDVAAEVAFLAMDLDRYGRSDLGAAFVDAYVQHAGDQELPRLLNFYKAYRAVVRGKVASLRLLEDDLSRAGAAAVADEARAYFALANRYAAVADGAAGT
jgi:aminoglycoside phosphotransferase family enzyme